MNKLTFEQTLEKMKPEHVLALYRVGRGRGLAPFLKHPRAMIVLRNAAQRIKELASV